MIVNLEKLKELKKKYNLKFIIVTGLFKEIIGGCLREVDSNKELFNDYYGVESNLAGDKVDFISSAIAKYSSCEPVMMIGDKEGDIEPGRHHNLKTIFCNYGHGSSINADITINNPEELINAIEQLL